MLKGVLSREGEAVWTNPCFMEDLSQVVKLFQSFVVVGEVLFAVAAAPKYVATIQEHPHALDNPRWYVSTDGRQEDLN